VSVHVRWGCFEMVYGQELVFKQAGALQVLKVAVFVCVYSPKSQSLITPRQIAFSAADSCKKDTFDFQIRLPVPWSSIR